MTSLGYNTDRILILMRVNGKSRNNSGSKIIKFLRQSLTNGLKRMHLLTRITPSPQSRSPACDPRQGT